MRFVRFGTGVVVGLALGIAVPLMAQVSGWPYRLGETLMSQAYGVPTGATVILGFSDQNGFLRQNSVAMTETIPGNIGGIPYILAGVRCP